MEQKAWSGTSRSAGATFKCSCITSIYRKGFSSPQPSSSQIRSLACVVIPNSRNYCAYANERLFLPNPVGTMLPILALDLYKWRFLLFRHRQSLLAEHIVLITANVELSDEGGRLTARTNFLPTPLAVWCVQIDQKRRVCGVSSCWALFPSTEASVDSFTESRMGNSTANQQLPLHRKPHYATVASVSAEEDLFIFPRPCSITNTANILEVCWQGDPWPSAALGFICQAVQICSRLFHHCLSTGKTQLGRFYL